MQSNNQYLAIVGDIIHSKEMESYYNINRFDAQKTLEQALTEINEDPIYSQDIAANFTITLGDEFQGLLFTGEHLFRILTLIESRINPIQIRVGIGYGEIETQIHRYAALGADGEAYYKARKMIEVIKMREKRYGKISTKFAFQSRSLDIRSESCLIDQQINTILSLYTALKSQLTMNQRKIVNFLLLNDVNQVDAAKELKIFQSSLNRQIYASNFYTLENALKTLQNSINSLSNERK